MRGLAKDSDIDEKTLRRIEDGEVDPRLGTLLSIARALGLYSIEELMAGSLLGSRQLEQLRPPNSADTEAKAI